MEPTESMLREVSVDLSEENEDELAQVDFVTADDDEDEWSW